MTGERVWWAKYVGIPYVNEGRSTVSGLDCWGLLRVVYRDEIGIVLPDYGEIYSTQLIKIVRAIDQALSDSVGPWKPIGRESLKVYDVVYMTAQYIDQDKKPHMAAMHVGIISEINHGVPSILHTQKPYDSINIPASHATVRNRIKGFCRHELLA